MGKMQHGESSAINKSGEWMMEYMDLDHEKNRLISRLEEVEKRMKFLNQKMSESK